ncbi:MAG: ATP-binding protein [Firmicutes bacterium]|nr:ATP-binding protein [Bacillota bacterium]
MFSTSRYVTGADFIGRSSELKELMGYVQKGENVSVYGLSRIGKTSLVKEFLRRHQESLHDKFLFFYYTLECTDDKARLFSDFSEYLTQEADKLYKTELNVRQKIDNLNKRVSNGNFKSVDFVSVGDLFYAILGIRIYMIIDEFDLALQMLSDKVITLREIVATDSINIISISRHPLEIVLPRNVDGSNLPGIVNEKIPVKGFSGSDLSLYRKNLPDLLPDSEWNDILYYTGNVPVFLNMILNSYYSSASRWNKNAIPIAYYSRIEDWYKSLHRLGIERDAVLLARPSEKQPANTSDLMLYGIVGRDGVSFSILYFKDFILNSASKVILDERISQYQDIVSAYLTDCDAQIAKTFQRNQSRHALLCERKKDLQAMGTKLSCCYELARLDTFVKCNLTEEEINEMEQQLIKIRIFLEDSTGRRSS